MDAYITHEVTGWLTILISSIMFVFQDEVSVLISLCDMIKIDYSMDPAIFTNRDLLE
jgi:hypothetical protein